MWFSLRGNATFLLASILVLGCSAWSIADDVEFTHQLGLADLASYRAALTGKATADDARPSDPAAELFSKTCGIARKSFAGGV